jgi:hypothetical protein
LVSRAANGSASLARPAADATTVNVSPLNDPAGCRYGFCLM